MLQYFLYDTLFGNTVVNASGSSFTPIYPYAEVYKDFDVPAIQPYYLYRYFGGNIVENTQANIDAFLGSTELPPTADGNVTYGQFTATTQQQNQTIDALVAATGTTGLQQVTAINATTTHESTFNGGLRTGHIRPTGDTITAIQIRKANGITPVISVDTVSGLTGFNTVSPMGVVHAYGEDSIGNLVGTEKNAVITDGPANVDKDIQWAENGQPKWLAETYRDEQSKFWYLYNVEANNSPITIRETGRIGFNKISNILDSHAAQIVGSGKSDIEITGIYTQDYNTVYELRIATNGTPDTFDWRFSVDDGITYGSWSATSGITTTPTLISNGVYVSFLSTTGHTIGNLFQFVGFSQIPQATVTVAPMGFQEVLVTNNYTVPVPVYQDITLLANGAVVGGYFTFPSGIGSTLSTLTWGTPVPIASAYFNFLSGGTGLSLVLEYWDGSSWIALSPITNFLIDGTANATKSGRIIWQLNTFSSWIKANIPGGDADLYWMRLRTSTSSVVGPVGKSMSVGNDKRFSIYDAFSSISPSVYVDSLGRMNIGGGNLTGSNKLQVNTANNVQVAVSAGSDSLVEFDNDNNQLTNLKLKLSSEDACGVQLDFAKTRGTLNAPTSLCKGDMIGKINFRGRVCTAGGISSFIESQYTGIKDTTRCSDIIFGTACGSPTSSAREIVRMTSSGTTGFGISSGITAVVDIMAGTASIAPLKFHSGSLLSTPQAGAVEFLGNKVYATTTGGTRQTFAFLDSPVFVGSPSMPSGTTFNQGLKTNKIIVPVDTTTAFKITKANGSTSVITVNTISGFTGFGVTPQAKIHIYGTDNFASNDGWNYQTNAVRLDGAFDVDKDIQWATEGQPKFTAQIYRCEEGRFWYLSSPQGHINQLTVSQTGRVGVNNQTNIMAYHAAVIGGGPNDLSVSGVYTQNYTSVYEIEIDSVSGITDTFRWRASVDEGLTFGSWSASIDLDYIPTEIQYGVSIRFDQLTGHTLGTSWVFGAFAQLPVGTFVITPNRFTEVQQTLNYGANPIIYTDITAEANSSTYGTTITMFNTGVTDNAIYFGTLDKLNSIFVNLDVPAQGVTLVAEYWNGLTWTNISLNNNAFVDNTFNLTRSGNISWETSSMTGWIPAYMPDKVEDGYLLYWVRLRTSTNATVAPIANSFARGGNYRLAVLTSPSDFKPSFYVDSLGRTNIGGGNMTGSNVLQINSAANLPVTSGGHDSLVEFDSENGKVTDLKLKISSNDACDTGLILVNTRGTLLNPLDNQTGDFLGHVEFRGRFNNAGVLFAKIQSQFTGTSGDKDADVIISTADNGILNEVVRVSSSGTTGFGVSTPTAIVHLKAGSTTIAPLKFNSGSLLSAPQAGAVEFLTDAYYGTITSGQARRTFAFLESPIFTGSVSLPNTTCLNNTNLCTYILLSGGTNNTTLFKTSAFNAYTASTQTAISKAITGATNGICRTDCHNICLGGILTTPLVLCGNQNICLQGGRIDIASSCGAQIWDKNGCSIEFYSSGGTVTIKGMSSSGAEKLRLQISNTQATITDSRAVPHGFEYNADYSSTFTTYSLVDKNYVDTHAGGLFPKASVVLATTGPITLSGLSIIGGVQTTTGMRVLVKNQTNGVTNGVYSASTGTWGRTSDFDQDSEVVNGSYFFVTSGATNQNTSWILSTPNPITVGVTVLTFTLFSASNGVAAGNGICVTQSGGNYNIAQKLASNCGLCVDASGLYVNSNIAGTGLQYSSGVINLNGSSLAGNSICWSGNSFNVNINSGTLSTALNSKLNTVAFNSYSASTLTNINNRLLTSIYSTYTGTTAPNTYETKTCFNFYTGTTIPNTYYTKTCINTYTGATSTALGLKANTASPTFTGTVRSVTPSANDNSTCIATTAWYLGQCATATPSMNGTGTVGTSTCWAHGDHVHPSDTSRLAVTTFSTYTGTTAPGQFASKAFVSTYTGTTAPNTYLSKTAFNTYSGTTVPANYYNKTQINSYTGATSTALGLKAPLASPTFTGTACAPKPAQNDNTGCIVTTSWYISQGSTALPLMDGTAACGTSNLFARQDHVHGSDTTKLNTTIYSTYTGTTAPATYATKANAVTGATNLGSGNAIYTSVSANKIQLKSISGGTGISVTNTGTQINITNTGSAFCWAGTTANGVGTYVSATCVCSNPNMTFNGSALSVSGNINASTYVCSPIITGSTRVCSPIVCGTSCIASPVACGTTCAISPITIGSTCVCSPIILASTSSCSPLHCGACGYFSTRVCAPIITGSTAICAPIIIGTTCVCGGVICATTVESASCVLASTYVCSPIITGSTRICSPIVCGTSCISGALSCGTTCVQSPIVCGTSCVISTVTIGSTCVCGPVILGSTSICSPIVCASTSLCSAGTSKLVGATTGSTLFLTTTPPAADITTDSTLFWSPTTKQIEAKKLTGGSDQYYYCECTTNCGSAQATCLKYLGYCPTTFLAGRYEVDFHAEYGNASANGCTFAAFKIDNVTQGSNYLERENVAAWVASAAWSRDVTLTAGTHCFDVYFWQGGGTGCMPEASVRVKRIC